MKHKWTFAARFRRHAFGWRSQPAIGRIKEAVAEIKKVRRADPLLAAEGAVQFLERVSPAIEQVDSSSGSIGTAVRNAVGTLVPIIAGAPAEEEQRERWLERLWDAHQADAIPYIESLGDRWGELCASKEKASEWADRLLGGARLALDPNRKPRPFFRGTSACLSALFHAERHAELVELLDVDTLWGYRQWAVKALAAQGKPDDAIGFAEASRGSWEGEFSVDFACERILLDGGRVDEAYERYGLGANHAGTYLAWFRAVSKKYPDKAAREILTDLVDTTPGEEGKWFAAAKNAKLFEEALELARRSPCDPKTLTRAARDFTEKNPEFAVGAGLLALYWLTQGYGYEIEELDVRAAFDHTMRAAKELDATEETRERIGALIPAVARGGYSVGGILRRMLDRG